MIQEEHLNAIANAIRTKNGDADSVLYTPEEMAPAILKLFTTITVKRLTAIEIVQYPSTEYFTQSFFSLDGLQVEAIYDDGSRADVTENVTSNIQEGTLLRNETDLEVILTYKENGITRTTSYTAYVTDITPVSWGDGTEEQIVAMVEAADAGRITLSKYWSIGDERKVDFDSIIDSDSTDPYPDEYLNQANTTLVLVDHAENYELATPSSGGKTKGSFIVQFKYVWPKDVPVTKAVTLTQPGDEGYVDNTYNYDYEGSFAGCPLDDYLNGDFYVDNPLLPSSASWLWPLIKEVKVPMLEKYNSNVIIYPTRRIFLPNETEIYGRSMHSSPMEELVSKQWLMYQAVPDFIKRYRTNDDGRSNAVPPREPTISNSPVSYWTRSPLVFSGDQTGSSSGGWYVCMVDPLGHSSGKHITMASGILPAFII